MEDSNVDRVINKFRNRMEHGYTKYGVTTDRDDLDIEEWLEHLQDELMDATIYVEKLKSELYPMDFMDEL